jgi:ubiquinone/menaquinone biosynthesis C-methylase UbiE
MMIARSLVVSIAAVSIACAAPVESQRFPSPDRPVARIVTSAYATEEQRDRHGEADRVMDRLGVKPGLRVADVGAGDGYYTVRLARRLGPGASIYAQDVEARYLRNLAQRLQRKGVRGVILVHGMPRDPRLPAASIDLALLSHMYHEIENPYEFAYHLQTALADGGRVAIIDVDRPTQDHGTPPALLRCELTAVGYRQVDFTSLMPAASLPAPETIKRCAQ